MFGHSHSLLNAFLIHWVLHEGPRQLPESLKGTLSCVKQEEDESDGPEVAKDHEPAV